MYQRPPPSKKRSTTSPASRKPPAGVITSHAARRNNSTIQNIQMGGNRMMSQPVKSRFSKATVEASAVPQMPQVKSTMQPTNNTTQSTENLPPLDASSTDEGLKAIFLDIDGVICCNNYCRLEAPKLRLLERIVRETNARVVLSSDWRLYVDAKRAVQRALKALNIRMIGSTPASSRPAARPEEINGWLRLYNEKARRTGRPLIKKYCAIDDRWLLQEAGGEKLEGHFERTVYARGLTEAVAKRVIARLT